MATNQQTSEERSAARASSKDSEVEGHSQRGPDAAASSDSSRPVATDTTADADVDGHMHPLLAEGIVANQQRDRLVEAERDRLANEARQQTGEVLDQTRRRRDE